MHPEARLGQRQRTRCTHTSAGASAGPPTTGPSVGASSSGGWGPPAALTSPWPLGQLSGWDRGSGSRNRPEWVLPPFPKVFPSGRRPRKTNVQRRHSQMGRRPQTGRSIVANADAHCPGPTVGELGGAGGSTAAGHPPRAGAWSVTVDTKAHALSRRAHVLLPPLSPPGPAGVWPGGTRQALRCGRAITQQPQC